MGPQTARCYFQESEDINTSPMTLLLPPADSLSLFSAEQLFLLLQPHRSIEMVLATMTCGGPASLSLGVCDSLSGSWLNLLLSGR